MLDTVKMWEEVSKAERIAIAGHLRPDGDCIGSCLGLYNYISDNFNCSIDLYLEEIPEEFFFLKNSDKINSLFPDVKPYDIFFAIDCGDAERLGKAGKYLKHAVKSYCIDHHNTNVGYADVNLIRPQASATAELMCDILDSGKFTKEIAECFFTGIVHDTGVFKHSNTTEHTFRIAGMLKQFGVNTSQVIDGTFFEKTYIQNQILGRCLMESILCFDGKVIFSSVDRKTQALYGLVSSDTDGVIDQLRVTKGVEVAILLKEMNPRVWRVSMRSNNIVNVAEICCNFGGGGHIRAAGCTLNGSLHDVVNTLTREIEKQLNLDSE